MRAGYPRATLLIASYAVCCAPALADDAPPLDDRLNLQLGGFLVSTETTLRVDGSAGETGTEFDWEGQTGTGDTDRFRVDALWRIMPRHRLRVMYFDNDRSGSTTLEREIEFEDEVFEVDLDLEARYEMEVLQVAYEYAFLRRETWEAAASIGVHQVDPGFRLRADLDTGGESAGGEI